jgi:phage-related protein
MSWRVEVLNETVLQELESLPIEMRAKLDHVISLIEEVGLHQVREPYVKPLRRKLWEIRLRGRGGIGRVLYVTASGRRIVFLHAFLKKTRKTPESAIRLALARARELEP